jgi:hypothetical protein
VRKHEATAALAFFSNLDVISVAPQDGDNPEQVASALINKELLNYRLTKTIPWFTTVIGGFQDAMKSGVAISFQYWKFKSVKGEEERIGIDPVTLKEVRAKVPVEDVFEDEPCVDLIPVENARWSPFAKWNDIVNTSPYFILIQPMFVYKVREMCNSDTGMPGMEWHSVTDNELRGALMENMNTTDAARRGGNAPPNSSSPPPLGEYDLVEVHLNFMDSEEGKVVYYTLKDRKLLSEPIALEKMFWHGKMPVTVGFCILDTHNPLPEGLIDLGKQLQTETNEVGNQRLDNVKLVLNKRWLVRRNSNVDTDSLMRNVPGGVTMVSNTQQDGGDIREVNWQDVTSSSYQEQDRINSDYDELVGNFATSSVESNRHLNETVGGMKIMAQGANAMTEYTIRTLVETWVEPILKQLILLEQHYESDEVILAIAGKKAKLFQRFGTDKALDYILNNDLTCIINIGMGATDPEDRLKRFMGATQTWVQMAAMLPPDADLEEIKNELYGCAGYRDPKRFFTGQQDPRVVAAQKALQQAGEQIKQLTQQVQFGVKQQAALRVIDQKSAAVDIKAMKQQPSGPDPMLEHHMNSAETAVKLGMEHDKMTAEQQRKDAMARFDQEMQAARLELDRSIAAVEVGMQHQKNENDHKVKMAQVKSPAQKLSNIEAKH